MEAIFVYLLGVLGTKTCLMAADEYPNRVKGKNKNMRVSCQKCPNPQFQGNSNLFENCKNIQN